MAEELRITVVDGGGSGGGGSGGGRSGPTAPSGGSGTDAQREKQTRGRIETVGAVSGALVTGNITGAISQTASAALKVLTGPIGIAALGITVAFGTAALAVKAFTSTVKSQVEALAGFSGEVAVAQAETQLRRQMSRFRRGQRIGSELASAENLRSRFETAMYDVNTEILGIVLRILRIMEPVLEPLLAAIETIIELPDRLASELKGMATLLKLNGMGFVADILEGMAEIIGGDDDDKLGIDIDPFLGLFNNWDDDSGVSKQPFKVRAEPKGGELNTKVEVGASGGV